MKRQVEHIDIAIPLEEHLGVQRAVWALRKVFLALVVIVAGLTLAGLFGEGMLSDSSATAAGTQASWERYVRYGKETVLEVHGSEEIGIPVEYFSRFKLERVVPEPDSEAIRGDSIVFVFNATSPNIVRFYLSPQGFGHSRMTMGTAGGDVEIVQFIYP